MASGLKCYFPNGALSPSVPCDPSAEVTHCCLKKEQCLTNGICAIDATTTYGIQYGRGVCSDPTWQSPVCPKVCLLNQDTATNTSAHDFRANGAGIYECNARGFGQEAEYCCESASEKARCCSTTTAIFTMPAATFGAVAIYANTTSASPTLVTTSTTAAGTLSTPNFTKSPSVTTEVETKKLSRDGTVAVGVGATLGFCFLIAALVMVILWRRQNISSTKEDEQPPKEKGAISGIDCYRHEVDATMQRHELAVPVLELPTKDVLVELSANRQSARCSVH